MIKYDKGEIEKIEDYMKSKEEIFKFILSRKVLTVILFYLGIFSIFIWIGGNSYIDHKVKTRIDKAISEKVDEEYEYLTQRNKITEIGDLAISTGKIRYHEDLKKYIDSKKQERIVVAARAELLRIENFFFASGDEIYPEEKLECTLPDGKIIRGYLISTKNLIEMFRETGNFGKKTTILMILRNSYEKDIPEFLLEVASLTDNLRMRYVALESLQVLIDNYSVNPFDYLENKKLWERHKEDFYKKIIKIQKKKRK